VARERPGVRILIHRLAPSISESGQRDAKAFGETFFAGSANSGRADSRRDAIDVLSETVRRSPRIVVTSM
jgi:hypothetical protein